MKFPRPRELTNNEYPELQEDEPTLFRNLIQMALPAKNSEMDMYIDSTIRFVKEKQKKKARQVKLNNVALENNLYFVDITFPPSTEKFKALVDTGASNSLIHESVAEKLNITLTPTTMRLSTATGSSVNAITGTAHLKFNLSPNEVIPTTFCTHFIVSTKLNNLQAILGAEFLLDGTKVHSISPTNINVIYNKRRVKIPIERRNTSESSSMATLFQELKQEIPQEIHQEEQAPDTTEPYQMPFTAQLNMNHNIRESMNNETLPPSEILFDNMQELKFELLEKTITLEAADYSDCPPEYLPNLKDLLNDYSHRFSKSKLDLEITDLYTADLPTRKGKVVRQKVRRLPNHKYEFTTQAIKQLMQAGVVRPSDSPWRSNVVLVKKPTSANESRDNTKASYQTGEQNMSKLYRICLDFRELNEVLEFPQQTSFTTIDEIVMKLKGKKVISLDISSAFFIIPIKEKDRYKTAFWVNQDAYEFCSLVMGLKSSPYHLVKFMAIAFSQQVFDKIKATLTPEEQKLLPASFQQMMSAYFDDIFVFRDTY